MAVLDGVGYKFIVQGGVMKISKGILVVIKENTIVNLLKLEGLTKVDHATVPSRGATVDIAHLWHQWLGPIIQKGMNVLVGQKLLPNLKLLGF